MNHRYFMYWDRFMEYNLYKNIYVVVIFINK